jgi:RNA polymerase sigma factor (sigma-70 family)
MDDANHDAKFDDATLLRRFIATRDQPAFAQLVRRHVDLVYSAARRQLHDDAAAQDVTQQVFVLLAEKAPAIRDGEAVAGWLLVTTRYVALNSIRSEARRRRHEREAAVMQHERQSEPSPAWDQVAPMLDEAVARLKREDRDALALRYFQGRSVADVAAALGVSQDAAQKRLSRALEKLRELFARRGVTTSAEALSSVLLANALIVAPATLGTTVAGAALSTAAAATTTATTATTATGVASGSAKGAVAIMAAAKTKLVAASVAGVMLVGVTGTIAYQQLRTPSGKARQVRVDPATTANRAGGGQGNLALVPAESYAMNPPWRKAFDAVYMLDPSQTIKHVPPPFIPERLNFYLTTVGEEQARSIPKGADAIILTQDANGLRGQTWRFGGPFDVNDVLRSAVGVSPQEVDLPPEVRRLRTAGDWVFRDGTTSDQRMAAFGQYISARLTKPYTVTRQPLERDVIVVAGKFEFRELEEFAATTRPTTAPARRPRTPTLHLFAERMNDDRDGSGGGGGGVRNALERVGDVTGYPLVYDTPLDAAANQFNYRHHRSFLQLEQDRGDKLAPQDKVDQLLANVAKQTSLTITRERRTIPIWVVKPG